MAEGFLDFTPGQVLTAAQVDDYLMRQAVMRFDDASARTTALSGVLVEGMMSYLKDTDAVEVYDGSAWVAVGGVSYGTATGGSSSTITVGGESYTMLTFTSSGTLTVTAAGVFDVLIVAGGGGGISSTANCGGGGAGGLMYVDKVYFDTNQTVTIGAGGALSTQGTGSSIGTIIAAGGGMGRGLPVTKSSYGASGGGAFTSENTGGDGDGITGNDGGIVGSTGPTYGGGGGGGAGAVGGDSSGNGIGGNGGAGADVSTWRGEAATTTYYAGGGGGSGDAGAGGTGGIGGGGDGNAAGTDGYGDANTGGGGGSKDSSGTAGPGGSGIILVRFKN
jgi:hypothetical protein